MLSVFPELYNYSHIAPFLLRLAVGAFFIVSGFKNVFASTASENQSKTGLTAPKILGILEILCGVFLLVGLFIQPVAIAVSIILIAAMALKPKPEFGGISGRHGLRFLLLAILLSLIILGPGIFAFDLPL